MSLENTIISFFALQVVMFLIGMDLGYRRGKAKAEAEYYGGWGER